MISLEGLTLITGREDEAANVLRTFAHSLRDGLLRNLFPRASGGVVSHGGRDAVAVPRDRSLSCEDERSGPCSRPCSNRSWTWRSTMCAVPGSGSGSTKSTRCCVRAGGLSADLDGRKVADWVVRRRRGKAVEINALWYKTRSRVLVEWLATTGDGEGAERWAVVARRTRESFNRRFWNRRPGCLYDVVDGERGDDASCRPNQVLAIALPNAVLDEQRWQRTLDVVRASCSRRSVCARCRRTRATTRLATTATSIRATRPIIKARSGRGSSAHSSMRGSKRIRRIATRRAAFSARSPST